VSDYVWETFDGLFKTVHRQGRQLEELEARIVDLEQRLAERQMQTAKPTAVPPLNEMLAERAA